MLENSLWHHYLPTRSVRETLAGLYGCGAHELGANEGELYALLKRHMTKRELRCFLMCEAGLDAAQIRMELGLEDQAAYETFRHRTYRKLVQDKIRNGARAIGNEDEEVE